MTTLPTFDARIEIPALSLGVKYEIDPNTNHIIVDRFLEAAMHYPCNYGYIPNTLTGDGDELDVLVITPFPLQTGVYIHCRPLGILDMTDEKGEDTKIIAVPIDKLTSHYHSVQSILEIEQVEHGLLARLRHFFEHYKDLDEGKWAQVQPGWGTPKTAQELIQKTRVAYQEKHNETQ